MGTQRRFGWLSLGLAGIAVMTVLACNEQPTGPTVDDFAKAREAARKRGELAAKTHRKKEAAKAAQQVATTPAPELTVGNVDSDYVYDPTGKRDPFRSFMWDRPDRLVQETAEGPLQKFDLNQLEVVAVVWRTGNARALVEDPSGESYIVGKGTAIGKNQGHVTAIGDNSVVVKETYVDYLGQETTKDVEMRVRRNEGG